MQTQEEILNKVLKKANSKKQGDIEDAWFYYLQKNLKFPFEAEINLISFSRVFKDGDIVKLRAVGGWVDLYGVIMEVKKDRGTFWLPIEELEVLDETSKNFRIIDAFLEWYGEAFA